VRVNAHATHCTTVAVIHQPRYETLMEFDHVILLATGGFLTYAGPTCDVVDYFKVKLGVRFPDLANPADIMMDAMSMESAKKMKLIVGTTAADLESNETFGEFLDRTWDTHADQPNSKWYGVKAKIGKRPLPDITPQRSHWGAQCHSQLIRAAIQSCRCWRHHVLMNVIMMTGVFAVISGLPRSSSQLLFFQVSFAYLFLMLANSMAGLRVFGGNERFVAWRESGVRINTFFYFCGRDMIALVEIGISAAVFTMVYWNFGPVLCSQHQMFSATFAFTYMAYGYSFLLSILMEASTVQMVSVLLCFAWWFLAGLEPALQIIAMMYPDYRTMYLMALSPVRWVHGYLFTYHFANMQDQQYRNKLLQSFLRIQMEGAAYDIKPMEVTNLTDWNCATRPLTVRNRWSGEETSGFGDSRRWGTPIGFNCNLTHLCLMGLLLRMLTVVLHTALCKVKARGGGSLFEGKRRVGFFSNTFSTTMNSFFWVFLVNLFLLEVVVLLEIP